MKASILPPSDTQLVAGQDSACLHLTPHRTGFRDWRNIASLTMSAVSSTFRAHFSEHSGKSAISLSLMVLPFPTQARL